MMNDFTLMFVVVWVVGSAALALVWWATRRIRQPMLRQLPRAVVAAIAYTPMLVAGPSGFHGVQLPVPAGLVLFGALFGDVEPTAKTSEQFVALRLVFTVSAVVYLIAVGISHFSKREGDRF